MDGDVKGIRENKTATLFNVDMKTVQEFNDREARSPVGVISLLEQHFGKKPVRVLEIGVFRGGLTRAFAASALNITAYDGVDPYLGSKGAEYTGSYWDDEKGAESIYQKSKALYESHHYSLHRMMSCEFYEKYAATRRYDIIYVDGDHRYRPALWDICSFARMLGEGGVLMVDDYANVDVPGVTQAVNKFIAIYFNYIERLGYWDNAFRNPGKYIPISQTTVSMSFVPGKKLPRYEEHFALVALVAERLQRLVYRDGVRRVALFGAGKHTVWLERILEDAEGIPQIVAVLDDRADNQRTFFGLPVTPADRFDSSTVDAVLLSSDSSQAQMEKRCRALYGDNVRFVNLYEGLPPGPYAK